MDLKIYHEKIKDLYIFFQEKYYLIWSKKSFTEKEESLIDNFVIKFYKENKLLTEDMLVDYFLFQYKYWSDKKTTRKITLNWIIGNKAYIRWLNKKPNWRYFVNRDFTQKFDYNHHLYLLNQKESNKRHLENLNIITSTEEANKAKFFNSDKGYTFCLITTTLYHPKSSYCKECVNSLECKTTLLNLHPHIYRSRIEQAQGEQQK